MAKRKKARKKAKKKAPRAAGASKRLVQRSVSLEKRQWDRLGTLARRQSTSTSALIRGAVVRYLEGWHD